MFRQWWSSLLFDQRGHSRSYKDKAKASGVQGRSGRILAWTSLRAHLISRSARRCRWPGSSASSKLSILCTPDKRQRIGVRVRRRFHNDSDGTRLLLHVLEDVAAGRAQNANRLGEVVSLKQKNQKVTTERQATAIKRPTSSTDPSELYKLARRLC